MTSVVVDTREHNPYEFGEGATVIRRALPAGDYSLIGHEFEIAVERKSLQDLVNTIIHSRDRFTEELKKLSGYRAACVVVEGSMDDVLKRHYRGNAAPTAILALATSIVTDWGIPVYWCSNRHLACWYTLEWLEGTERWLTKLQRANADLPSRRN